MRIDSLVFLVPPRVRRFLRRLVGEPGRRAFHENERDARLIFNTYRLHVEQRGLVAGLWHATRRLRRRTCILCYPHLPGPGYVLYKIAMQRGYALTDDPRRPHDAFFSWRDHTYKPRDRGERRFTRPAINGRIEDVSKSRVNEAFRAAFGYDLGVDPTTYEGRCVKKSEENAAHDGEIIACPIEGPPEEGFAYQRLVQCELGDGRTEDMRVPIFGGRVPFVYVKRKPEAERFDYGSHTSAWLVETGEVLSEEEVDRIRDFAGRMELDCGEMDVMRDREDGRIYVVDANDTPAGPAKILSDQDYAQALRRISGAFEKAFL